MSIDPIVARFSGGYLYTCIPVLPMMFVTNLTQKYLQCQGVVKPMIYIGIVSNILNVLANYLFLVHFKYVSECTGMVWYCASYL